MNLNHHQDIDRVLSALGHTDPPTGLEARIARRLSTTTAVTRPSLFARMRYAMLATSLGTLAIVLLVTHRHHSPQQIANIPTTSPVILSEVSPTTMRETQPKTPDAPIRTKAAHTTHPPLCDCDPTALAETLAPSHPAPPMPLTPQERLLILATRPGSPLEVAELDQLREPLLRAAAEAQEHAQLRQVMQGLLRPLAIAQSLNTTNPTEAPAENTQPAPEPTPSN